VRSQPDADHDTSLAPLRLLDDRLRVRLSPCVGIVTVSLELLDQR